jgi:hypothetical protein
VKDKRQEQMKEANPYKLHDVRHNEISKAMEDGRHYGFNEGWKSSDATPSDEVRDSLKEMLEMFDYFSLEIGFGSLDEKAWRMMSAIPGKARKILEQGGK